MPKLKYDMGSLWEQHKEEALKNGVGRSTYIWRIYRGWDPKEAASTIHHFKRESLYK